MRKKIISWGEPLEYWARIGKIAEENPDLNFNDIKDLLIGLEQVKAGMVTDYQFG